MMRHARHYVLLAGFMLGLLFLTGSALAAFPSASSFPYTSTTLTHTGVEHLLVDGEHLRLTSKIAEKTEVRLFVYARALNRGGERTASPPGDKVYISDKAHVIFDHPGVRSVTLHVNSSYRTALLRAGTITEGYYYAGYQLIRNP